MAVSALDTELSESTVEHLKRHFSICHSWFGSCEPLGFQSQMFLVFISQVKVLKVGVPDVGYEPFAPQGGVPGLQVPFQL